MATVQDICDRVCSVTGLSDSGTDRAQVLSYVNQAYSYAVLELGAYTSTFSVALVAGQADYGVADDLGVDDILELRRLWLTDASVTARVLAQIPESEMVELRQSTSAAATPLYYALRGTRELLLHPAPTDGATLGGSYLAEAPALVESGATAGQEASPSAIPAPFHYDVISNKAIALAMEYDNRFEEAAAYDAKWATAMERLMVWAGRFGGPEVTSVEYLGYEGPRDMA